MPTATRPRPGLLELLGSGQDSVCLSAVLWNLTFKDLLLIDFVFRRVLGCQGLAVPPPRFPAVTKASLVSGGCSLSSDRWSMNRDGPGQKLGKPSVGFS